MKYHSIVISSKLWGFSSLYLHYDNRCVYWFWTVFSGKRCGPWASCPAVQSAVEKPKPRLFLQPLFDLGKFPFSYRFHMLTIFSLSSSTVLNWPEETALTFSEIPAQTRFLECFVTIEQCLLKAFFVVFDLIESTWSSILEKFGFCIAAHIFLEHQPYSMTWNYYTKIRNIIEITRRTGRINFSLTLVIF